MLKVLIDKPEIKTFKKFIQKCFNFILENVEKKQSDSIITNSFIDEIFSDEKLEYLDNPLDENDFVTLIEEFKAIYNSSYVNM